MNQNRKICDFTRENTPNKCTKKKKKRIYLPLNNGNMFYLENNKY